MGQTIAEKIFSSHVGRRVVAGDVVVAPLDLVKSCKTVVPPKDFEMPFAEMSGDAIGAGVCL